MQNSLTNSDLLSRYQSTRALSEKICAPLETEDMGLQCMPDVSPPKWHLAHTSWFFEEFILKKYLQSYREHDPAFTFLFNSYYNGVGERHTRANRGHLSRPLNKQVLEYRKHVDQGIATVLAIGTETLPEASRRILIGINHEQQHQELLLSDIKYNFFQNPLFPAYNPGLVESGAQAPELSWKAFTPDLIAIGAEGTGFSFDNEHPRHQVYVSPFSVASRLVNNSEYQEFIKNGGYRNPEFWLSEGWDAINTNHISAPLYWHQVNGEWVEFTLAGNQALTPTAPVVHLSFFEADAYARFSGHRLLFEREWEAAVRDVPVSESFLLNDQNPAGSNHSDWYGNAWQWTIDSYLPHPGYSCEPGALGEYNGKFMCNQKVLKGGSRFTPPGHIRPSYRNFFPTHARWQRSGIRLAKSI